MVRTSYSGSPTSPKGRDRARSLFKRGLFRLGLILSVIGVVLIAFSYQLQGTYTQHNNLTDRYVVNLTSPQIFEFTMITGAPMNVTYFMPEGQSLHYSVNVVKEKVINGDHYTVYESVESGVIANNSITQIDEVTNPTLYAVVLSTPSNVSILVTVHTDQQIPRTFPVNMFLLVPGVIVLVSGVVSLTMSTTREFRK